MHLIQEIGSYAGLAAIPGLAVLSALYFSQARDVRRLREWAGRAPERAAEQAQGGRVVAQPQQAAASATAAPAAQPAAAAAQQPAAAGVQGAKPAVAAAAAGAATATAAGPAAAPAADQEGATQPAETNGSTPEASDDKDGAKPATPVKPGALTPAAVAAAASAAKNPARPTTAAGPRPGPPALAGTASATTRRPIPSLPSSSKTSVIGAGARPVDPWYRRLTARLPAGRYIALIVAGALVLGGGAAFAISQLGGSDNGGGSSSGGSSAGNPSSPGSSAGKQSSKGGAGKSTSSPPAVDPSKVTVTVVNGTAIPNLARDTATKLSGFGFQIGNKVTGTGSLAAAESVVEYRPGSENDARAVAAKLHISQKQPADQDAIAQAGPAQVIVVLGADQAPGG